MKNPRVFLDIQIGTKYIGKITIELFADLVPKTAENFRGLCTGEYGRGVNTQRPLSYIGCKIFKVVAGQYIQSGDFVNNDGSGGESVYGGSFEDENFTLWHAHAGVVSMANSGPNSNTSQFYITLKKVAQLNRRHVVFGQVRGGMDILRAIEKLPTDAEDRPRVPVFIVGCGKAARGPRHKGQEGEKKESAAAKGKELLKLLLRDPDDSPSEIEGKEAVSNAAHSSAQSDDEQQADEHDKNSQEEKIASAAIGSKNIIESASEYDVKKASRLLGLEESEQDTKRQQSDDQTALEKIRSRLDQSRVLNSRAVNAELKAQEKSPLFTNTPKKPPGWSDDPKWYLSETAQQVEAKAAAKERKKRSLAYEWSVANARSVYKAHEKSASKMTVNLSEYAKQKAALGEQAFYESHKSVLPLEHTPNAAAKERLMASATPKKRRIRQRMDIELGDVTYINERNKKYNRKLEKSFGAYTIETKQNLERGTAL